MASWLIRIDSSSGKSRGRRRAICSGLHARAHRRGCRRPCRRPFHVTTGLGTIAPLGAMITPASRSCTYCRNWGLMAILAGLGLNAARSACHCAVVARYAKPPERVAALRRNSLEIVDGARVTRRAISRTPCPWARQSAICSRSVNARYRPDSGGAEGIRCDAGMPPASRNHRVPTAGDTPALTAASSLECPVAIAAQNWRCSSRRRTEGRPGERSFARPARSDRLLRVVIATPFGAVLRRPVELRLTAPIGMMEQPLRRVPARQGHPERVEREVVRDALVHRPADGEARTEIEDHRQVEPPLARRNVGDVGDPRLVRSSPFELPRQNVGGRWE